VGIRLLARWTGRIADYQDYDLLRSPLAHNMRLGSMSGSVHKLMDGQVHLRSKIPNTGFQAIVTTALTKSFEVLVPYSTITLYHEPSSMSMKSTEMVING
jgi:hypothetical protein